MQVSVPGVVIINGKARDGKSHLAHHLMYHARDYIDYAVSFSTTAFNEENLSFMPAEFKHRGYDTEMMQKVLDKQEALKDLGTIAAIIIDDNSGDGKMWSCKRLALAVTAFYHFRLLVIICVHHINKVPPLIRQNATQVAIFGLDTKSTIKAAYESYGQEFDSLNEFKAFIFRSLSHRYNFIYKDKEHGSGWILCRAPAEKPEFYLNYSATHLARQTKNSISRCDNIFWQKKASGSEEGDGCNDEGYDESSMRD
jgi:hypothetical protein